MKKKYYEIVVVSTFIYATEESAIETFRHIFGEGKRIKRTFNANINKLTVFSLEAKKISTQGIKRFEDYLKLNGYIKLYSVVYSDLSEVNAHFFTFKTNPMHFSDINDLLISKIEKALGKKLKNYENIYYFHLTKSQAKSKVLSKLLDELTDPSFINIITCI